MHMSKREGIELRLDLLMCWEMKRAGFGFVVPATPTRLLGFVLGGRAP